MGGINMRKYLFFFLIVVLLLTNVVGVCFGADSSESKVLRITAQSWQINKIFIGEAAERFMKDHPEVKVEIQTYAEHTVISNYAINWMRGETPVDIAVVGGVQFASQFVARDLIYDFNELNFFDEDFSRERFVQVALKDGILNGKQYVIPLISEIYAININLEMFRKAGLVDNEGKPLVPADWNEFYEFAKKLHIVKDGNIVQQGAAIQWGDYVYGVVVAVLQASRGNIFAEDGKSLSFDNPEFREILKIWKKGADAGIFSKETFADSNSGRNSYKAGKIAMLLESASRWIEAGPILGTENVSVIPIPGSLENGSYGFGSGLIIPKCSPVPELAVQFIKEQLLSEYVQTSTLNEWGKGAVIKSYYNSAVSPEWLVVMDIANKSVPVPPYRDVGKFTKNTKPIIQRYLAGESTLEQVINELETMMASLEKY